MLFLILPWFITTFHGYITEISPFQKTQTTSSITNNIHVFSHENFKRDLSLDTLVAPTLRDVNETADNPLQSLPIYKGSLLPDQEMTWDNYCFKNNTISVAFDEQKGYQITLEAQNPRNWYCQDWYIIMTSEDMSFNIISSKGTHTIKKRKWESDDEYQEAQKNGIRIFSFEGKCAYFILFFFVIFIVLEFFRL